MSAGRLVALSNNGKLDLNAINSNYTVIGVLQEDCTSGTYENPKVRLLGTGTCKVSITGTPLTTGDALYTVTSGQLAGTIGATGGTIFAVLEETTGASTNGQLFEVRPVLVG